MSLKCPICESKAHYYKENIKGVNTFHIECHGDNCSLSPMLDGKL